MWAFWLLIGLCVVAQVTMIVYGLTGVTKEARVYGASDVLLACVLLAWLWIVVAQVVKR